MNIIYPLENTIPLSKAPYRTTDKHCPNCKKDDATVLKPYVFNQKIDTYETSITMDVPTCVHCHKEVISFAEVEYVELLAAREALLQPGRVSGNTANQVRRILGLTTEEWRLVIGGSDGFVAKMESQSTVPDGYALMLLGMVERSIVHMES